MMIGPSFVAELGAAGLKDLSFSWTDTGQIFGRENLTPEQNSTLESVLAAHDPTKHAPVTSFLAQDLLALLTSGDCTGIQAAISSSVPLWLLWQSLLAQRDPIEVTSLRFQQGWAGLMQALGIERANAIANALGISS